MGWIADAAHPGDLGESGCDSALVAVDARARVSHRVVKGLRHAERCEAPAFARNSRTRGVKHRGIKYERAIAASLGNAWIRGQWFHFLDTGGGGWCQTDFLRELEDCVLVLEAKLSWVPEGRSQLELLYRPVVEAAFRKPMVGVVICKRMTPGCDQAIAQTLASALEAARSTSVVLHWAGVVPLVPSPRRTPAPLRPLSPSPSAS